MRCQTEIVTRSSSSFCTFYKSYWMTWSETIFFDLAAHCPHFFLCALKPWMHNERQMSCCRLLLYCPAQNILVTLLCEFLWSFYRLILSVCEVWVVSVTSWKDFTRMQWASLNYLINANCWNLGSQWKRCCVHVLSETTDFTGVRQTSHADASELRLQKL